MSKEKKSLNFQYALLKKDLEDKLQSSLIDYQKQLQKEHHQ